MHAGYSGIRSPSYFIMSNEPYEFDGFHLDCRNFTLSRNTEQIPLQPRTFDTLLYLVEHAGSVVTKEELIRHVWADAEVQDNALMRCISQLRKALDDVEGDGYIRTIPGRGYQFCAAVTTLDDRSNKESDKEASPPLQPVPLTPRRKYPVYLLAAATLLSAILAIVSLKQTHKPSQEFKIKQLTTNARELPFYLVSISSDGKMISFADDTGLFVSDINTIARHPLTLPKNLLPVSAEWFPDNLHLLVSGSNTSTHQPTVWSLPILGGAPTLLLEDATNAMVSPDGERIAFVRHDTEIWIANADGSSATLFETARPNEIFTFRPQFVADGRSIIIGSSSLQLDHSSIAIRHFDGRKTTPLFEIGKTVTDFRLIGNDELIVTWKPGSSSQVNTLTSQKVNLDTGALSQPRELVVPPNHAIIDISATRNGNMVALLNSRLISDVYLADLQTNGTALSNSRRLTLNDSQNRPASWLADNRTVVFYSDRSGRHGIYRQAIDTVDAFALVNDEHRNVWPVVSADQHWLFYFSLDPENGTSDSPARLMRMPLTGGKSEVIDAHVDTRHSLRCATTVSRCVLANHVADKIIYFEFNPETGRGRELARVPWKPVFGLYDWDVSADGAHIAYIDAATGTDTISVITLGTQSDQKNPATITHLHVSGQQTLRTLHWDSAGKGFYVSTYDEDAAQLKLLHIAIDGSITLLRQQLNTFDGWAIPSPDGKHLAFQKYTLHSNIWLLQRQ